MGARRSARAPRFTAGTMGATVGLLTAGAAATAGFAVGGEPAAATRSDFDTRPPLAAAAIVSLGNPSSSATRCAAGPSLGSCGAERDDGEAGIAAGPGAAGPGA